MAEHRVRVSERSGTVYGAVVRSGVYSEPQNPCDYRGGAQYQTPALQRKHLVKILPVNALRERFRIAFSASHEFNTATQLLHGWRPA
jgi:hypothetical protein